MVSLIAIAILSWRVRRRQMWDETDTKILNMSETQKSFTQLSFLCYLRFWETKRPASSQHTFLFFLTRFGLFLGCSPQGIRKHRGTVDTDVIKVWLVQEVVLTLTHKWLTEMKTSQLAAPCQWHWLESVGNQLTEDTFFFFPLWPDFDFVFFALGFFFTSLVLFLLFLTPGPGTHTARVIISVSIRSSPTSTHSILSTTVSFSLQNTCILHFLVVVLTGQTILHFWKVKKVVLLLK